MNGDNTPPHRASGGEDWQAVTDALNARMAERRMTQQALAKASGVSVATLRLLQRGVKGRRVQDANLAAVSRALGWPDGHLLSVLLADAPADPARPGTAAPEPRRCDMHETLLRMEAQLAAMDGRLAAIEYAVTASRSPGAGG
jgi:transcriptional regulator with XRE-family HTH domain